MGSVRSARRRRGTRRLPTANRPAGYPPPGYEGYPPRTRRLSPPGYQQGYGHRARRPATRRRATRRPATPAWLPAARLSAARLPTAWLPAARLSPPGYPARLSGCAQAGRHPAAPAHPVRHLQRRRRLRADEPEGDAGPDHDRRRGRAQLLALVLQVGPLAATGGLASTFSESGDELSDPALIGSSLSSLAGAVTTGLAAIVLSGLLTVVVGRAVFGAHITIGEAWQRARGRLLALIGFTALEALGAAVAHRDRRRRASSRSPSRPTAGAAFVVGAPLVAGADRRSWSTSARMLSFAPTLIVLERLGVVPAIKRSFALVKNDFWRVFGISAARACWWRA